MFKVKSKCLFPPHVCLLESTSLPGKSVSIRDGTQVDTSITLTNDPLRPWHLEGSLSGGRRERLQNQPEDSGGDSTGVLGRRVREARALEYSGTFMGLHVCLFVCLFFLFFCSVCVSEWSEVKNCVGKSPAGIWRDKRAKEKRAALLSET